MAGPIAGGNGMDLLDVWALWCRPCIEERPYLGPLHREYGNDGVTILAIEVGSDPRLVRAFAGWTPPSFTALTDEAGTVADSYDVRAFPTRNVTRACRLPIERSRSLRQMARHLHV